MVLEHGRTRGSQRRAMRSPRRPAAPATRRPACPSGALLRRAPACMPPIARERPARTPIRGPAPTWPQGGHARTFRAPARLVRAAGLRDVGRSRAWQTAARDPAALMRGTAWVGSATLWRRRATGEGLVARSGSGSRLLAAARTQPSAALAGARRGEGPRPDRSRFLPGPGLHALTAEADPRVTQSATRPPGLRSPSETAPNEPEARRTM